jgi:hypothetical protein
MKYKDFETLITKLQGLHKRSSALCDLGIDTLTYNEDFYMVIELLMDQAFSDYNRDWIEWFLYERVTYSGEILKAHDAEGNEICYDIKSLWKEVTN